MTEIKKIGIITSGGDCGGINAVIKGAAGTANKLGIEAVVIPNGYAGLYNLIDFEKDELVKLTPERMAIFNANTAGSEAGHSRVKIKKIDSPNKYIRIKEGLLKHEIDALVISGGDDTGSVAKDLAEHDIKLIHAPKTMDFDLQPYSVGADSTMNVIAEMGRNISTTGRTHKRIMILEVFGRYVGHSAFRGGVGADADCILIPEITPDFDIVYEHMFQTYTNRILSSDVKAGWYLIVTSEAMRGDPNKDSVDKEGFLIDPTKEPDSHGHYTLAGAGKHIEKELKKRLLQDPRIEEFMKKSRLFIKDQYEIPEVRVIKPTHLVRCGPTSAYDANFGNEAGVAAIELLLNGKTGMTVCGIREGKIYALPIEKAIQQRHVNLSDVAIHEERGICFGRKYQPEKREIIEVDETFRHM